MGLIHAGLAQHGSAVLAYHQTAGKGQRGKNWDSAAGESLNFSIVLNPEFLNPVKGFELLASIAVTVQKRLELYIGDETTIKWPNDLYWRDRKAGGILIESVINGNNWRWCVAGIGLNIKQTSFPAFLPNPVSFKQITGKDFSVNQLAIELRTDILEAMEHLQQNGFVDFFNSYNQKLYKKNCPVQLKQENRKFETVIQGVNNQGQLITGINSERVFDFGHIEWLLQF